MINDERKKEIEAMATSIDHFSERYQLIHATVAIERLYKDQVQSAYQKEFAELRQQVKAALTKEEQERLRKRACELKQEINKRIHISIEYNDKIDACSSRTTRTQQDTFLISLPKCMTEIRDEHGNIDYKRLEDLRKLMAHELGHIALHSGIFGEAIEVGEEEEQEANYFAEKLLSLRKKHGRELFNTEDGMAF